MLIFVRQSVSNLSRGHNLHLLTQKAIRGKEQSDYDILSKSNKTKHFGLRLSDEL